MQSIEAEAGTSSPPPSDGSSSASDLSPRYEAKTRPYRRYLTNYSLASFGIALLWGALLSILLPLHVEKLEFLRIFGAGNGIDLTTLNNLSNQVTSGAVTPTSDQQAQLALLNQYNSARAGSLSLVKSAGVVLAMLMQPIIGTLSDRTRSRWGRRSPYIAGGAVAGAALVALMPSVPSIALLVVAWSLIQLAGNVAQGPLAATVADRVSEDRLGGVSALSGLVQYGAAIVGAVAAGSLFASIGLASYYPIAIALVLLCLPFLFRSKDKSSLTMHRESVKVSAVFASFIEGLRDRDYRWAWISKVLLWIGFGISTTYGLYMLETYVQPALSETDAAKVAPLLQVVALPATLLSMAISGRVSDRAKRRKPFVIAASLIMTASFLVPWAWPTLTAMYIQAALSGIGLGAFLVVDQAMFIELLPDPEAKARDLGLSGMGQNLGTAIAPVIAGLVVTLGAGAYGPVWPAAALIVLLSTFTILPIKRVR